MYRHYVEKMTQKEINRLYPFIPYQTIKTVLSGRFNPEAYFLFMEMLEHELEMLDSIFKV